MRKKVRKKGQLLPQNLGKGEIKSNSKKPKKVNIEKQREGVLG